MQKMSSRQRLLNVINRQEADHIPCSFMSFTALRKRYNEDMFELSMAELDLGLDSFLFIPAAPRSQRLQHPDLRGLPVRFSPSVTLREWREKTPEAFDILHKEYITPAGTLSTRVQLSEDWPHGNHIPFVDDYQVPRALKPLVTSPADLPSLQYLLLPPSEEDKLLFKKEAAKARDFVDTYGVFLVGGWGVGMDMADWLCGVQELTLLSMSDAEFVDNLLEMIYVWNKQRMEVVLSAPVDLYIRRAWYEGCDFVSPRFYRRSILPRLKAEVDLAHEHGARFGYICSSGTKPMLDDYLEAGIDVLIGIDPIQGTYTDMPLMKEKIGSRVCLWGGVSGAITVELGTEEEIRSAVRQAIETLGPDNFILSPVDNITIDSPQTWRNIDVFLEEWRKLA